MRREEAVKSKIAHAHAKCESERAIIQAEAALAEAQIRAEAFQTINELFEVEPALPLDARVSNYLENLSSNSVGMSKTLRPTSSLFSALSTAPVFVCREIYSANWYTHHVSRLNFLF